MDNSVQVQATLPVFSHIEPYIFQNGHSCRMQRDHSAATGGTWEKTLFGNDI